MQRSKKLESIQESGRKESRQLVVFDSRGEYMSSCGGQGIGEASRGVGNKGFKPDGLLQEQEHGTGLVERGLLLSRVCINVRKKEEVGLCVERR